MDSQKDDFFMSHAIKEALSALEEEEIPIGAVIVCEDKITGRGHNQVEMLNDVTAHAEILAITAASNYLGSKYLENCKIYVTLEPCVMCATAINMAHINHIYYGVKDPKKGYSLYIPSVLNRTIKVHKGIRENECADIIKDFFKKKRT